MTAPDPFMDGAVNVPHEPAESMPTHMGWDTLGENDNFQATDAPSIDRHII